MKGLCTAQRTDLRTAAQGASDTGGLELLAQGGVAAAGAGVVAEGERPIERQRHPYARRTRTDEQEKPNEMV